MEKHAKEDVLHNQKILVEACPVIQGDMVYQCRSGARIWPLGWRSLLVAAVQFKKKMS